MTALVHTVTQKMPWFNDLGIWPNKLGAKQRRLIIAGLYGNWFRDNGLKLTRDYMVEIKLIHDPITLSYERKYEISISIKDPTKAMLFKLTLV